MVILLRTVLVCRKYILNGIGDTMLEIVEKKTFFALHLQFFYKPEIVSRKKKKNLKFGRKTQEVLLIS